MGNFPNGFSCALLVDFVVEADEIFWNVNRMHDLIWLTVAVVSVFLSYSSVSFFDLLFWCWLFVIGRPFSCLST